MFYRLYLQWSQRHSSTARKICLIWYNRTGTHSRLSTRFDIEWCLSLFDAQLRAFLASFWHAIRRIDVLGRFARFRVLWRRIKIPFPFWWLMRWYLLRTCRRSRDIDGSHSKAVEHRFGKVFLPRLRFLQRNQNSALGLAIERVFVSHDWEARS